jgi:hypothetical protein
MKIRLTFIIPIIPHNHLTCLCPHFILLRPLPWRLPKMIRSGATTVALLRQSL